MNKFTILLILIMFSPLSIGKSEPPFTLIVDVTVPDIQTNPYHRPYIAVWLESTKRKGIHTLAFWREQEDWFKDLRQWWRKIGRKNTPDYDAVSGATRKPGTYTLTWQGKLENGKSLPAGEYVLHFESVREQGSREYFRQKVNLGSGSTQSFKLNGQTEFGVITISIK